MWGGGGDYDTVLPKVDQYNLTQLMADRIMCTGMFRVRIASFSSFFVFIAFSYFSILLFGCFASPLSCSYMYYNSIAGGSNKLHETCSVWCTFVVSYMYCFSLSLFLLPSFCRNRRKDQIGENDYNLK